MISFWVTLILFPSLLLGRFFFKRWINPIFLYVASWSFILYLYDLKLIGYIPITKLTWIVVASAFISFLLGVLVVYLYRDIFRDNSNDINSRSPNPNLEWNGEEEKLLKKLILITAAIGLGVAIINWFLLIRKFGSIALVLINASDIYKMRVSGEHLGKIPYLNLLSFVSVFLSAIYSAHRNKFTYLVIIPFLAVVLNDASSLARAGVFFAFVLFGITFVTARYFYKTKTGNARFGNNKNIIITSVVIVFLAFGSVSLIRLVRNPMGDFKSTSIELKELSKSGVLSSSVYLYFSSPVAVLSRYLDSRNESAVFGENTFYPVYNNLNKIGMNFNLKPYPKGYFIPMWVNSATYLRDLDVDFGAIGIFLIPFLIGFFSTFFWYKFFSDEKLIYLTLYSFTSILIVFSVFYIGSRLTFWFLGGILSLLTIIYFEIKSGLNKRAESEVI